MIIRRIDVYEKEIAKKQMIELINDALKDINHLNRKFKELL